MFKIAESPNRVDVYHNNILIFSHRNDDPSLSVAVGEGFIKKKGGSRYFKDQIKQQHIFNKFKVSKNTESYIEVTFIGETLAFKANIQFSFTKYLEIQIQTEIKGINRIWLKLPIHENEHVYGCGEQFSHFCLNNKKVPLWVQEQGVNKKEFNRISAEMAESKGGSQFDTYFPQPTFLGISDSVNYFCLVDTSAYGHIHFHKKTVNTQAHELFFREIPKKIVLGYYSTPIECLTHLTEVLGRQPKLPDWTYEGMWIGMQGFDEDNLLENIRSRLQKFLDANVYISAIWSQNWQGKGQAINNPDFPEFTKEMEEKEIRYLGYNSPFISINEDLYKIVPDHSYFVQNQDGSEYQMKIFENKVVLFDLTNPDCYNWVKSIIKEYWIKEVGLSGWMSNFGEYLPLDAKLHSGEDPKLIHNLYPLLFAKANLEAIQELHKEEEIIFFSRAGYSNISKFSPLFWAGNQHVGFDGLNSVILAVLSAGCSGIGYHHSDIGGVVGSKRSKELLMRWTEQATFTMVMRSNEGNLSERNWQLDSDEETIKHLARMTQIHVALKPYLQYTSKEYQETGIPCIRAPVLHYPNDLTLREVDDQYLLGRDLWIVPVVKPKVLKVKYILPEEGWVHLWSGKILKKGKGKINADFGYPAVFYRAESEFFDLFETIRINFK